MQKEEKKQYLKQYMLQQAKMERLKEMCRLYPEKKVEYENQITAAIKLRKDIESSINNLQEPLLCELLYQKYILGKTLEELSLILNYSLRHTERLHKTAIEKIKITPQI